MVNPVEMSLHKKSKRFDIAFDDGSSYSFTFEFLRVFSPSADVTGRQARRRRAGRRAHGPLRPALYL